VNDGDLEHRALTAAAETRAKAEALRQAKERKREAKERRRRAKEEHEARHGAARGLEEILGHKTSPDEWGIWRGMTYAHGRYGRYVTATLATLKLLGVDIRGDESYMEVYPSPGDRDLRDEFWRELTLVSFGEALEKRQRPQDSADERDGE
jgi:hypothetical protein